MIDKNSQNFAAHLAQLTAEFLDEATERVVFMLDVYERARIGREDATHNLPAFRRELHTMKGQGGSFGFASISLIAHRFEEFLLDFADGDVWAIDPVKEYLYVIERIVQERTEPTPDAVREILKKLPTSIATVHSDVNVVWVCDARVIRHKVRRDLEAFGFNVVSMNDPFEALRYICKAQPEFVICSATLQSMSGFDLIRVLATISDTQSIPSVLVTSFDVTSPKIAALPKHVPIVKLTPNIGNELAHALSSLEFKRVDPEFSVRGE